MRMSTTSSFHTYVAYQRQDSRARGKSVRSTIKHEQGQESSLATANHRTPTSIDNVQHTRSENMVLLMTGRADAIELRTKPTLDGSMNARNLEIEHQIHKNTRLRSTSRIDSPHLRMVEQKTHIKDIVVFGQHGRVKYSITSTYW